MALPEKLYYSLPSAVKEINKSLDTKKHIDIDDLLHYVAIGMLEICFKFSYQRSDDPKNINPRLFFLSSVSKEFKKFLDHRVNDKLNDIHTQYGSFSFHYDFNDYIDGIGLVENSELLMTIPCDGFSAENILNLDNLKIFNSKSPRTATFFKDEYPTNFSTIMFVTFENPLEISCNNIYITKDELKLLINGGDTLPIYTSIKSIDHEVTIKNNSGRPSNDFNEIILSIVKETRNIYPTCTGESLAVKLYNLLKHQPNHPKQGTIKVLISKNIPTPKDKDTKLNYNLVIPEKFMYLKNK